MPARGVVYPSAHDDNDHHQYQQRQSQPPPRRQQEPQYYASSPPQRQNYPQPYDDDGYNRSQPQRQQPPSHNPPVQYTRPEYQENEDDPRNNVPVKARGSGPARPGATKYETEDRPSAENVKGRKCHDVIWLILYIISFGAMVAVAYYSIRYGNVDRLIYGRDSEGNLCGASMGVDSARDLSNQTDLFYFVDDPNNYRRCVPGCPTATATDAGIICMYDVTLASTHDDKVKQVTNHTCTYTIDSKSILNRCIPQSLLSDIKADANATYYNQTYSDGTQSYQWGQSLSLELNARDVASIIFQDLAQNWWVLLVCVGASFVLSFGYLLLLQFFAGVIVWFTIFVVLLAGWILTAYFIYNYVRITQLHQGLLSVGFSQVDSVLYNEKLLLALSCIFGGISLILTLAICCLMRRIRLATRIIREASASLRALPWLAFFPFFKYSVILVWMAIFVAIMALLATSGSAIATAVTSDVNSGLTEANTGRSYSSDHTLQYLQIYFTFGFLWTYNFIVAIGQCTVAGAIATWYWARDKKHLPRLPVLRALGRTFRYHLGSLAFGSLLIAIVQLIRILILMVQKRVQGVNNKFAKAILCCCQCCFKCIESLLKMLTKNAYVEIAVYGYSFCTACRMAMQLIASNILRLAVVHQVSNFLIFVGKLAVVFLTTLGGLVLLVHLEGTDQVFANYAVPAIFIIIFSYITASAFLSTFSMAITTIFLSFCEDSQRNDGSRERPYYMSKNLQNFVDAASHAKPSV
ncbi:hypothetical protein HKX48_000155 [Thoreauomyces humboldtii]|nr:hypothetical protein HKX48_000155 [Thoreauomyces humboldtii]